ncbi:MAG: hypothetical protein ACK5RO_10445 [Pseudobdellovibrionaceae bacterium]|jgi:hypothetical protein
MDLSKIQYFERVDSKKHRDFISSHNNCILCGTVLELQHVAERDRAEIKEEAHCPSCELRTRVKTYTVN